ncbi:putative MFS general substrate transporter [Lyophyllum shimeji]|uniref:MFS general substrate transporter n=1 Tax=Lyophyllum shimeji TaxID=47721 RepID=A0A9P3UHM0_LYOSH|nr:putative MFS general substrate transporter [Lyophyllum shimeji]
MASKPVEYPGLISVPRLSTLVASLAVTLVAGTNYAFSAYAPQLGSRLRITHTHLNVIGLAGNVGVFSSGPIWGRIADLHGPRLPLASAFSLLLAGYSGIRFIYDAGVPASSTAIPSFSFCALVLCSFMTGVGSNAGLNSAVNSTTKTFPDKARATATGVVLSGFGLSAFLFSTTSRVWFAGNPSSFILLLSLAPSIPMMVGYFLVRPIPLPPAERPGGAQDSRHLWHKVEAQDHQDGETRALLPSPRSHPMLSPPVSLSRRAAVGQGLPPNVYGRKLWLSKDFWLLFTILSLLSGTGLMYINNVGSISQALYAKSTTAYKPVEAARWQADQVSTISVLNCMGRIVIGLITDYGKHHLGLPRSYCFVLVSAVFLASQVMVANIDDIHNLWLASATLGLAHGSAFSLLAPVCLDWFGMPHFSENSGYLALSPIFAGNLFSFVFGRTLDSNSASTGALLRPQTTGEGRCVLGRQCYVEALYLTMGACFVALVLSFWAGWRDRMLMTTRRRLRNLKLEVDSSENLVNRPVSC